MKLINVLLKNSVLLYCFSVSCEGVKEGYKGVLKLLEKKTSECVNVLENVGDKALNVIRDEGVPILASLGEDVVHLLDKKGLQIISEIGDKMVVLVEAKAMPILSEVKTDLEDLLKEKAEPLFDDASELVKGGLAILDSYPQLVQRLSLFGYVGFALAGICMAGAVPRISREFGYSRKATYVPLAIAIAIAITGGLTFTAAYGYNIPIKMPQPGTIFLARETNLKRNMWRLQMMKIMLVVLGKQNWLFRKDA